MSEPFVSQPGPFEPDEGDPTLHNLSHQIALLQEGVEQLHSHQSTSMSQSSSAVTALPDPPPVPLPRPLDLGHDPSPALASFPDPEIYTGDPDKLQPWLVQMSLKLSVNYHIYDTERLRLYYAFMRLGGHAARLVAPYISLEDNQDGANVDFRTYHDLVRVLQRTYGDPNPRGTAQRAISRLRQKGSSFQSYCAEFQRLAGDTGFDEEALKHLFVKGLSEELFVGLLNHPNGDSGSHADLVHRCRDIDYRQRITREHTDNPHQ